MGIPGLGLGTHLPDTVCVCSPLCPGEEATWSGPLENRKPKAEPKQWVRKHIGRLKHMECAP